MHVNMEGGYNSALGFTCKVHVNTMYMYTFSLEYSAMGACMMPNISVASLLYFIY